jgi:HJR/Mrr/RecB family endonuclease
MSKGLDDGVDRVAKTIGFLITGLFFLAACWVVGQAFWVVGDFAKTFFNVQPRDPTFVGSALTTGFGAAIVIGVIVLIYNLHEWQSCPHGMSGGKTQKLCAQCIREAEEIEENTRRQLETREREQRIDAAATGLQTKERIRIAKSIVPSIEELRRLTPQGFEDEIARMFERLGFEVRQTPYTNDGGRDAILIKEGKKYLLECKKYKDGGLSGRPDLQKFHSAIVTDGAISGFFVTAGRFTKEANELAKIVPIELIDNKKLLRMMFDSKPSATSDDSYRSMCRQCEDIVSHRLRVPRSVNCRNGHAVAPTLNFESVLSAAHSARDDATAMSMLAPAQQLAVYADAGTSSAAIAPPTPVRAAAGAGAAKSEVSYVSSKAQKLIMLALGIGDSEQNAANDADGQDVSQDEIRAHLEDRGYDYDHLKSLLPESAPVTPRRNTK